MFARKTAHDRPAHRRHPLFALVVATVAAAAVLVPGGAAQAATRAVPARGHVFSAWQSTVTHEIHVHGFALHRHPPRRRITVGLFVNGRFGKKVLANDATPAAKSIGRHGFTTVLPWPRGVHHVRLAVYENGHRRMN